jgi:probable phosphoglycerate mutase
MALYLVRHGETRWNVERRLQGRTDSPLTLQGLEQIRGYGALLRRLLAGAQDVELHASPLGRTRQTASLIAELIELPPERYGESELLLERYCGAWEGRARAELFDELGDELERQWRDWSTAIGGDGETLAQVRARAEAFLERPQRSEHLVVVTHGVMSRVLRGAYLGLGPDDTQALERHTQDRLYVLEAGRIEVARVQV